MQSKFKWGFFLSLSINLLFVILFFLIIKRLGGFTFVKYRLGSNTISAMYDHKQNLYEHLDSPKGGIVFLGDSITEGGEWAELFEQSNIRNRGIAGDVTSGMLNRLGTVIALEPEQIFLMIGINDLLFISVEEITENYKAIVDQLTRSLPNCQLYLQSVLPINNQVRDIPIVQEDILLLNENIQKIAKQYDLPYIDLYQELSDASGRLSANYTLDGIHINGDAYIKWRDKIKHLVVKNTSENK